MKLQKWAKGLKTCQQNGALAQRTLTTYRVSENTRIEYFRKVDHIGFPEAADISNVGK